MADRSQLPVGRKPFPRLRHVTGPGGLDASPTPPPPGVPEPVSLLPGALVLHWMVHLRLPSDKPLECRGESDQTQPPYQRGGAEKDGRTQHRRPDVRQRDQQAGLDADGNPDGAPAQPRRSDARQHGQQEGHDACGLTDRACPCETQQDGQFDTKLVVAERSARAAERLSAAHL